MDIEMLEKGRSGPGMNYRGRGLCFREEWLGKLPLLKIHSICTRRGMVYFHVAYDGLRYRRTQGQGICYLWLHRVRS